MRSKNLLIEIIELLEKFEKSTTLNNDNLSLDDFIYFLQQNKPIKEDKNDIVHIAQNVSFLHRYSKFYIKKALKGSLLQTVDEYTYLVALFNEESLSKTEINNRNVIEKTSGNEIMRRLLKAKLIGERRDKEDRRRMRVFITDKGRAELLKVFPALWQSAMLLSGILSPHEKESFLQTSDKLCDFHKDIFVNSKEEEIDNLMVKLSPVNQDNL
ncbi:MAG: MarR family winged helix-turn-helix transcriptional regulator [Bacteroidia bacterium]|nr:MarR family winged helix-turn-helix transcriptional regulator [Bacteroidia bacterium]